MQKSIPTDLAVEQRTAENLSLLIEGEHSALHSLVQRRLNRTLNARRQARTEVVATPVADTSDAPYAIDPLELLGLLGQLNKPQPRSLTNV